MCMNQKPSSTASFLDVTQEAINSNLHMVAHLHESNQVALGLVDRTVCLEPFDQSAKGHYRLLVNSILKIENWDVGCDKKSIGVIVLSKSWRNLLIVKGALENLLERSSHMQLLDVSVVELDS